jgi:hypothetical protein
MGFMGLGHWVYSDNASGFRCGLLQALEKTTEAKRNKAIRAEVSNELQDMANNYNTPGYLNLALCLEVEGKDEGFDDALPVFSHRLTTAQLKKAVKLFDQEIPKWNTEHRPRARELRKVVAQLLAKRKK